GGLGELGLFGLQLLARGGEILGFGREPGLLLLQIVFVGGEGGELGGKGLFRGVLSIDPGGQLLLGLGLRLLALALLGLASAELLRVRVEGLAGVVERLLAFGESELGFGKFGGSFLVR